jgi:hypothetical protein
VAEDDDNSEEALVGDMKGTCNDLVLDGGGVRCVDRGGGSSGRSDFLLPVTSGSWLVLVNL